MIETKEQFLAERDKELGRWRDPIHTEIVVYPDSEPGWVIVLNEITGRSYYFEEGEEYKSGRIRETQATQRYFKQLRKEKPWLEAKPGEVWIIEQQGADEPALVWENNAGERYFMTHSGFSVSLEEENITSAKRAWPCDKDH